MKNLITYSLLGALALTSSLALANKLNSPGTISVENVKEENYPMLAKVSLPDAISAAQKEFKDARPVAAKLGEIDDFLVYKVKLISPDNKVAMVVLDAGNSTVLKTKNKNEKFED